MFLLKTVDLRSYLRNSIYVSVRGTRTTLLTEGTRPSLLLKSLVLRFSTRHPTYVAVNDARPSLLLKTRDLHCRYRQSNLFADKETKTALLKKKQNLRCC